VRLDLNAKRAERAKQRGEPMQMVLGDQTFDLVDEMPIDLTDTGEDDNVDPWRVFRLMLANPDADMDRLKACKPSFNDAMDIIEFYGSTLGESLRSIGSSLSTGEQSRPTGTATTGATSPPTATAPPGSAPGASPAT
jgi:hypothetical protein